ncbi:MAG: hypothetical protein OXJ52_07970 [Oligoflexia bacterium]|nr:hypothetical protein [Oligoflexia bacterium]
MGGGRNTDYYKRKLDTILWYSRTKNYKTNKIARDVLSETTLDRFSTVFNKNNEITYRNLKDKRPKEFESRKKQGRVPENLDQVFISKYHGRQLEDYWTDIKPIRKRISGDSCKEDFLLDFPKFRGHFVKLFIV